MKKSGIFFLYLFCSLCASYAAKPSVLFSTCTFDNPSGKPYVEVYLNIAGKSVTAAKKADGKFQGIIQVQLVVKKDNAVVYTDKYNLNSPVSEQNILTSDFVDVQRISLENGSYNLQVKVSDNNAAISESFIVQQEFQLDYPSDHISISDIELLESFNKHSMDARFVKNGIEMIPYPANFYPPALNSVKFYAEVYHASAAFGPDSNFIIRYRVDGHESKKNIHNIGGLLKARAAEVNVLLTEISIEKLQSGNYNLVVEAVNKENVVMASKNLFIQRASQLMIPLALEEITVIKTEGTFVEKITEPDTLKEFIRCLYPISDNNEQMAADAQVKLGEQKSMQQYILYFWMNRNRLDPEAAWLEYKVMVDAVNYEFKTLNRKGYESDRGRVYLQYGSPNERSLSYFEPRTNPYEIWHYYKLSNQTNRRFVFLNNNSSSNDFALIHSDATGEINQPRWELMLEGNQNNYGTDWNTKESPDYFGKNSRDLYIDPK